MNTDQDTRTRPAAPVIPLPQPAAPTPTRVSGPGQVDAPAPREVLALYSRQADELAATVETALADEDARYEQLLGLLAEQHQRRRAVLARVASTLGQQCTDLDEAAATLPRTAGSPATVFGFAAGDRVRDPRSGCTGRVRIHALAATERAEGRPEADVVWDGFETVVDLALAVAGGLERLG